MKKKKIIPTCRLCEKLSEDMTHCAIYGPLGSSNKGLANKEGNWF